MFFFSFEITIISSCILLVMLAFLITLFTLCTSSKFVNLPPGPPSGWLGTLIPKPFAWRTFEKWTHKYGSLFTVWLGRKPLIVVGTYKAAMDLLEKQSAIFADRPPSIMAGETLSGGMRTLLMRHGDRWRRSRKALHNGLQPKMAATFEPLQEAGAHIMALDILRDPTHHLDHAREYAAALVLRITYGKTGPSTIHDPEIKAVLRCSGRLQVVNRPGVYLVDSFPILRYLPGKWKTDGRKWHKEELALYRSQLQCVKDSVAEGKGADCFARYLLDHLQEYDLNFDEAAYVAGSMFGAGSGTTAAAISVAIMAITCYPEASRKAQDELDCVVGRERAPTFTDEKNLPYLQAFVKEVFRWRPVSSGGFMHAATEDFAYNGHVIPKGAAIVGNHWAISRDTEAYGPNTDEFRPERWFTDEDDMRRELRADLHHVGYGFGRRACAGKNVANRSVFINCATLLWTFQFSLKNDDSGNPIPIDTLAFSDTANSHPLPFHISVQPRFEGAQKILEDQHVSQN